MVENFGNQVVSDEELVVLCEGGLHTIAYLVKNGINPHRVCFDVATLRDLLSNLNTNSRILIIIQGLTDFTLVELYELFSYLNLMRHLVKDVTVLSNIELGFIDLDYYIYKGDLVYGALKLVGSPEKRVKNNIKSGDNFIKNAVMQGFSLYKHKTLKIYHKVDMGDTFNVEQSNNAKVNQETDDLVKNLVHVDLYSNNSMEGK